MKKLAHRNQNAYCKVPCILEDILESWSSIC